MYYLKPLSVMKAENIELVIYAKSYADTLVDPVSGKKNWHLVSASDTEPIGSMGLTVYTGLNSRH